MNHNKPDRFLGLRVLSWPFCANASPSSASLNKGSLLNCSIEILKVQLDFQQRPGLGIYFTAKYVKTRVWSGGEKWQVRKRTSFLLAACLHHPSSPLFSYLWQAHVWKTNLEKHDGREGQCREEAWAGRRHKCLSLCALFPPQYFSVFQKTCPGLLNMNGYMSTYSWYFSFKDWPLSVSQHHRYSKRAIWGRHTSF